LPLDLVPKFAQLKVDDVVIYPLGSGMVISQVRSVVSAPVAEDQAGPVILQFLRNRDRNTWLQAEISRLRKAAQVTYMGEFAGGAPQDAVVEAGSPAAPAVTAPDPNKDSGLSDGIRGLR